MRIYVGSDHAGFPLKEKIVTWLKKQGHDVTDFGAPEFNQADDYPDFIVPVAKAVSKDPENVRGIVLGGSGQGEAIAANKLKGVRAIVCYALSDEVVRKGRSHNNANILSLGAWYLGEEEAEKAISLFLFTPFDGERHERRIKKIDAI